MGGGGGSTHGIVKSKAVESDRIIWNSVATMYLRMKTMIHFIVTYWQHSQDVFRSCNSKSIRLQRPVDGRDHQAPSRLQATNTRRQEAGVVFHVFKNLQASHKRRKRKRSESLIPNKINKGARPPNCKQRQRARPRLQLPLCGSEDIKRTP